MASTAVELVIALTAKDAASAVLGNVAGKFQALGAAGKAMAAGIAIASGAVVAVAGTLTALATKSAATAGEVTKLKRELGLSAEEASKLRYAGERLGLDVDELSTSFKKFDANLITNKDRFKELGIQIATNKQGNIDFLPTLGNVSEKFKTMPDGVEKSALAVELFGKKGLEMIPFLNQGRDGLKTLGDKATALGLVFDDQALGSAARYKKSQKDIGDAFEGVKNRIGMAFLPILADLSVALMGFVNAWFPAVVKGLEKVSEWFRTAAGVVKDMFTALQGGMSGGGDFLGKIIGPAAAATFMGFLRDIGARWHELWTDNIKPAIAWAQENVPKAWEMMKTAVSNMWTAVQPKLQAFVDKLADLREKFDSLPPAVQQWAAATAVGVVAVKVTGLDSIILGWASALGTFSQAGVGAIGIMVGKGLSIIAAIGLTVAAFAILALGIGAVIFVGSHLQELEDAWVALAGITRITFAGWADIMTTLFNRVVQHILDRVNEAIGGVNLLIKGMNLIPGVNIPLISKIKIDLPNADNVARTLADLARDRTSTIYVNTSYLRGESNPFGGSTVVPPDLREYAHGSPFVPQTGLAIIHRGERIIPAAQNKAGGWGGVTININADVVDAQGFDRFADRIGEVFMHKARMAGGRV